MKNNKLIIILSALMILGATATFITACNKERPDQQIRTAIASNTLNVNVSMEHNWLKFKDVKDYDKAASILDPTDLKNFIAYVKSLGLKNKVAPLPPKLTSQLREGGTEDSLLWAMSSDTTTNREYDTTDFVTDEPDFLAGILNEDGIVQIEGYIFKLNFETQMAYVLNPDNIVYTECYTQLQRDIEFNEEYSNLVNCIPDVAITEYTFNADLIDLYFPDEDIDLSRSSCNESACAKADNPNVPFTNNYNSGNVGIGIYVWYKKYALWCEAKCKLRGYYGYLSSQPANNGVLLKLDYNIACYKPRCQGAWGPILSTGWIDGLGDFIGTDFTFTHPIYVASRYLTGIKINASARIGLYSTALGNNIPGTEYSTPGCLVISGTPPCQ